MYAVFDRNQLQTKLTIQTVAMLPIASISLTKPERPESAHI